MKKITIILNLFLGLSLCQPLFCADQELPKISELLNGDLNFSDFNFDNLVTTIGTTHDTIEDTIDEEGLDYPEFLAFLATQNLLEQEQRNKHNVPTESIDSATTHAFHIAKSTNQLH